MMSERHRPASAEPNRWPARPLQGAGPRSGRTAAGVGGRAVRRSQPPRWPTLRHACCAREPANIRITVDAAMALTELVHDDLEHFGTSGYVRLSDEELGIALRALRAVLKRLDIAFEVPFVGSPGTGPQPCGGPGGPSAGGPQPSGGRSGGCWDKVPSLSAIWTRTVERVRAALRLQADCRSITRQGNLAKQSQ